MQDTTAKKKDKISSAFLPVRISSIDDQIKPLKVQCEENIRQVLKVLLAYLLFYFFQLEFSSLKTKKKNPKTYSLFNFLPFKKQESFYHWLVIKG